MPKKHVPTIESRAKVNALSSFGIPLKKIAKYMELDVKTLGVHYEKEIETASIDKIVAVGNALFQKAIEGNVTAMVFFLKTRGQWRETDRNEYDKDESVSKIQIEVIGGNGEVKE